MAGSSKKKVKAKSASRATPRKKAISGTPVRVVPPPPPRPKLTPSEVLAELRQALSAALDRSWAGLSISMLAPVGVVDLHAVRATKVRPHWHLVTTGLVGKGFELSLKVPAQKEEVQPPPWAIEVLASIVRRVGHPGAAIAEGQCVSLGAPLEATLGQEMQAVALGRDAELSVETEHGQCPVLLAVGITLDEERLVREWSPTGLLEVMAKADPLLLTDLDRGSLLLAPRARVVIEQRAEREGSSMGTMWARVSTAEQTKKAISWQLSADAIETLVSLLKGRLGHQRPFVVQSDGGTTVEVVPGDAPPLFADGVLTLKLSQTSARAMRSTLRAKPGKYSWEQLPGFVLEAVG